MANNTTFDPFTQVVTLLMPDGVTPFNVTLDELNWFTHDIVKLATSKGAETGATIIALLAVLLLTPAVKYRTTMFLLNTLALFCNVIRTILADIYYNSRWTTAYLQLVSDFSILTPINYSNSVAARTFSFLTFFAVLCSMMVQIWVVFQGAPNIQRYTIFALSLGLGLATFGYQLGYLVINNRWILNNISPAQHQSIQENSFILTMTTFIVFTVIFTGKLGMVMFRRRRLGQRQFGPMQVLFILGIQTLIVPTVVALAQFFAHVDQLSEWYLTLAVICLPFSALWASATPDQTQSSSTRIPFFGSSKGSNGTTLNSFHKKSLVSEKSGNHDPLNFDTAGEIPPLSPTDTSKKTADDDLEAGLADSHLAGQSRN